MPRKNASGSSIAAGRNHTQYALASSVTSLDAPKAVSTGWRSTASAAANASPKAIDAKKPSVK